MIYNSCASCGAIDGDVKDDRVIRLSTMNLLPSFARREDGTGKITVCTICRETICFDFDGFNAEIEKNSAANNSNRITILFFLTNFMIKVWDGVEAPSVALMCKLLNKVGLYSQNGKMWSYHNLTQWMARNGIDLDEINKIRGPEPAIRARESVDPLLQRAADLLHEESVQRRGNVEQQISWQRPEQIVGMPVPSPSIPE